MTSSEGSHKDLVRQQFGMQAARYEQHVGNLGSQNILAWIVSNLDLEPHFTALDVATGTGLLARAVAPHVSRVTALDATPEMMSEGRRLAKAEGVTNVVFEQGDAGHLPYPDGSFDLVACRIALHHFQAPREPVQEMFRVCRAGGHMAIIDIASADDRDLAASHNRLERLRDPSHTRAMPVAELREIAEGCGLEIVRSSGAEVEQNLNRWMDLTDTGPDQRRIILDAMNQELEGGTATGMRPFRRDGEIMFYHSWLILVGRKPAPGAR